MKMLTFATTSALPILFAAGIQAADKAPDTTAPAFALVVKPVSGRKGTVASLEVHEKLAGGQDDVPISFKAAISATGVLNIADSISDLSVSDPAGAVPLEVSDDPPNTSFESAYRHWKAARPVRFPVEVAYRIPAEKPDDRGAPVGMKPAGQGIVGGGIGFLLLPEDFASTSTRMSWDLSALPTGSIGVISAGEGTVQVAGPPSTMTKQWFLAGPAVVLAGAPPSGYRGYAIGNGPFDNAELLKWGDRMYSKIGGWFRYLGLPPYRLFVRSVNGPSFGTGVAGEGRGSSLVNVGETYWPGQNLAYNQQTVAHEMTHQWTGLIEGRASWFEEGLTVYVSTLLPCQTGMLSRTDCVQQLNGALKTYFTSPARNWSQERIDASPFTDEKIRAVPYGRGALYFADLEMKLRAKSHGRHGLSDALFPLLRAREEGNGFKTSDWEAMLQRKLGSDAVTEFRQSMIEGTRPIVPPSDAFGPCWQRVAERFPLVSGGTVTGFRWAPIEQGAPKSCGTIGLSGHS